MRPFVILTAIACLFGLTGLSSADQTIASPAIFGAHTQGKAQCIMRNTGNVPISVTVKILDESGNTIPASNFCGAPLMPGDNCSVFASINFGVAYACSATTPNSAKKLRGALILFHEVDLNDWEPVRSAQLQ